MKHALLILASIFSFNAYSCGLGDICVGSPNIVVNVPSGHARVNLKCHVWSFYSNQSVDITAVAGRNLKFHQVDLNGVTWKGKDVIISAKYANPSIPGEFTFVQMNDKQISSQCYLLSSQDISK